MRAERLALPDVLLLTPQRHGDERGWLAETYSRRDLAQAGVSVEFVQDNHVVSRAKGAVRGLHWQIAPHAIAKLIRVTRGAIFDAVVDVRAGSPTFGQWAGAELSADSGAMLYAPAGFAHGYLTLTEDAEVHYKLSGYYAPQAERGLRWNDPVIGIAWPAAAAQASLNARDAALPLLSALDPCDCC